MSIALRYALQREEFALDVDLKIPMRGISGIFGESGSGKNDTASLHCGA